MKWNIKDCGDGIEKLAAQILPKDVAETYNKFWGNYIGHRNGKPINIAGISDEDNLIRLKLGQWCYTLLQNHLILNYIQKEIPDKIQNNSQVLHSLRLFTEVTNTLYNSGELINKYNSDFDNSNINISWFNDFIEFRNTITHNIRPLYSISENQLLVPSNFQWFSLNSSGSTRWIWPIDNFDGIEYSPLKSFVFEMNARHKQLLFDLINASLNTAKEIFNEKVIDPPTSFDCKTISTLGLTSGDLFVSGAGDF